MAYISVPQLPPSMFRKNIGIIGPCCKSMFLKVYLVVNSYLPIVMFIMITDTCIFYLLLSYITNLLHIIPFTEYEFV